jgi:hypothetical protein
MPDVVPAAFLIRVNRAGVQSTSFGDNGIVDLTIADGTHIDALTVLHHWQNLTTDLPSGATTTIARRSLPASDLLPSQLRARSVVHVRYTQVGDPEGGARLFRRLRRAAPVVLDCAGTH